MIPHANNERNRALKDGAHVPDYAAVRHEGLAGSGPGPRRDDHPAGWICRPAAGPTHPAGAGAEYPGDLHQRHRPRNESGHNPARFRPSGPLTGMKRSLTEKAASGCRAWLGGPARCHGAGFGSRGLFRRLVRHRLPYAEARGTRGTRFDQFCSHAAGQWPGPAVPRIPLLGVPRGWFQPGGALPGSMESHSRTRLWLPSSFTTCARTSPNKPIWPRRLPDLAGRLDDYLQTARSESDRLAGAVNPRCAAAASVTNTFVIARSCLPSARGFPKTTPCHRCHAFELLQSPLAKPLTSHPTWKRSRPR